MEYRRIKNLVLDFNGVIATGDISRTRDAFIQLGLNDVDSYLDVATQRGLFGNLESGNITAAKFIEEFCRIVGRNVSYEEIRKAWCAFIVDIPMRGLCFLESLRKEGYKVLLLSNTNPFVASFMRSKYFDGEGNTIDHYFDNLYLSYEVGEMKPSEAIFDLMLRSEGIYAEETLFIDDAQANLNTANFLGMQTMLAVNGEDWTHRVAQLQSEENRLAV